TNPTKIVGDVQVTGIECIKMELGEPDSSGRRSPVPIAGSEFILPVDMVIKSLGQISYTDLLQGIDGLTVEKGKVKVDPETMQSSVPKLFAGGDCINGGKETVNAVQDGKMAALGIHKMIFG
ncbi:MAG: FAD-dependent oxidoreductase, partial [Candidatus Sericytochromatia bacterium]